MTDRKDAVRRIYHWGSHNRLMSCPIIRPGVAGTASTVSAASWRSVFNTRSDRKSGGSMFHGGVVLRLHSPLLRCYSGRKCVDIFYMGRRFFFVQCIFQRPGCRKTT